MQVTTVTATVKYTQDTGRGAWKSVELGAEATVSPGESWRVAQAALYQDLGHQLKPLWAQNGAAGGSALKDVSEGHQVATQASNPQTGPDSQQPVAHFCQQHGVPFKSQDWPPWGLLLPPGRGQPCLV
jgi:hypothetical protein